MSEENKTLFDKRIFSARLISKLIVFEGEDLRAARSLIYGTWSTCTLDEAEGFLNIIKSGLLLLNNYNPAVIVDVDEIIEELKNILSSLRKEEETLTNIKNGLAALKTNNPALDMAIDKILKEVVILESLKNGGDTTSN